MKQTLTTHERITISLGQIAWSSLRISTLLHELEVVKQHHDTNDADHMIDGYTRQLTETAELLDDISQTIADFTNNRDINDKIDKLVLDGGFEALRIKP